ncbi:hypothetical protein [Brevibacillus migulae]|uniref:hypothetical protein n=1 Tax=Brevibacillus migulae TaxID=1644114 RepID=UPI00106E8506|nr:hypothetical protein [Brevibacillus migulae]
MQIFATFEYTPLLEIAISELETKGITDIYAVPLDLRKEQPRLIDSLHRADGMSLIDKAMILAFMFSTIGASKGFVWKWGPIIWGIIGAVIGFVTGVLINWIQYRMKNRKLRREKNLGPKGEVILIVTCEDGQAKIVEDILWDHLALGLAKTK